MPIRRTTKPRPRRRDGERKSDTTRRNLTMRALELFQKKGVAATTMRDIAKAAKLSLGAAYYYFPSKEALMFAYYADNQAEMERVVAETTGDWRARLTAQFHAKVETVRPQRRMLATIVQRLVDPGDPLSAFSGETRAVRDRAIAMLEPPLRAAGLPADAVALGARALWLLQLASLLLLINDASPGAARTHGLIDDALAMALPLVPLLATPLGHGLVDRASAALARAGVL
jgi:AcrR family transcriptional regulator